MSSLFLPRPFRKVLARAMTRQSKRAIRGIDIQSLLRDKSYAQIKFDLMGHVSNRRKQALKRLRLSLADQFVTYF